MKSFVLAALLAAAALVRAAGLPPLPVARPEDVGLSSERLGRVDRFVERLQSEGRLAGAVTVVARRGRLVSLAAHGFADIETQRPMRTDDIFQIQSMTKPIVTVAALMLLEEGRFLLTDPVSRFLPEFHDMTVAVAKADAPAGHVLVRTARGITVLDLLTHRAGFTGLPPGHSPAEALRRQALQMLPANGDYTLDEYVRNLAASPLESQPGTTFRYGPATEVLGRLIEVVSGRPLDAFLRERIFQPLGMIDTGFTVPEDKRSRIASIYALSPEKGLAKLPPHSPNPRFHSAGGNLFSTPSDYLRFCQMLLNRGELEGHRLLSRKSVELMTARQVDPIPLIFLPGQYFGLGVAVRKADGESGLLGSTGTYGWSGGYNTYFRIDPQEELLVLLFAQLAFSPVNLELQYGVHNTVMQAVID